MALAFDLVATLEKELAECVEYLSIVRSHRPAHEQRLMNHFALIRRQHLTALLIAARHLQEQRAAMERLEATEAYRMYNDLITTMKEAMDRA